MIKEAGGTDEEKNEESHSTFYGNSNGPASDSKFKPWFAECKCGRKH